MESPWAPAPLLPAPPEGAAYHTPQCPKGVRGRWGNAPPPSPHWLGPPSAHHHNREETGGTWAMEGLPAPMPRQAASMPRGYEAGHELEGGGEANTPHPPPRHNSSTTSSLPCKKGAIPTHRPRADGAPWQHRRPMPTPTSTLHQWSPPKRHSHNQGGCHPVPGSQGPWPAGRHAPCGPGPTLHQCHHLCS